MLYDAYETQRAALRLAFATAAMGLDMQAQAQNVLRLASPFPAGHAQLARNFDAAATLARRFTRPDAKPAFNLGTVTINGKTFPVREDIVQEKPFGRLIHFAREGVTRNDPKILLVAPMSGHHATLLRDTVRGLLPYHDAYITDWANPRDVSLAHGTFGLEDYIAYVLDFIGVVGPEANVAALSQSTVPLLAAVSIMAARNDSARPVSMILAGGPVDTRAAPSQLGQLAKSYGPDWYRQTQLHTVPMPYEGHGRTVYPGFVQFQNLSALNPARHAQDYTDMFFYDATGQTAKADAIRQFRDEYESVADLDGEFYLDTIRQIFQEHALPRGTMTWKGLPVSPAAIRDTALLTIEGTKDDICPPGQTYAAHGLCSGLPAGLKFHALLPGADHYNLFGTARMGAFIRAAAARRGVHYDTIPPAMISKDKAPAPVL